MPVLVLVCLIPLRHCFLMHDGNSRIWAPFSITCPRVSMSVYTTLQRPHGHQPRRFLAPAPGHVPVPGRTDGRVLSHAVPPAAIPARHGVEADPGRAGAGG